MLSLLSCQVTIIWVSPWRLLALSPVRSLSAQMHSPKSHQQMSHDYNTISSLNGEHYVWEQQWHTSQLLPGHQGYGERSHLCLRKGDTHRRYSPLQLPCPYNIFYTRGADKSLAGPTSRFILFDGENISFDASLVMYINSTNIPPIMIINRIYETQNLLSL